MTNLPALLRRITYNSLTSLPAALGSLPMRTFWVTNNLLTDVPLEYGAWTNIENFWVNYNSLLSVPPALCSMTNVQDVDLKANFISSLPPCIANLRNLK